MHIYISQKIQKELNLSNRFLAGSILPDMIKIMSSDRSGTHYLKEYNHGMKLLPDLDRFLEENKEKLKDEVILGYYAHLIEDRIWFDTYVDKFAKCIDKENVLYTSDNSVHSVLEFRKDIYSDYISVDTYLIKHNSVDIDLIRMQVKKELEGYNVDKEIEENVILPSDSNSREINFISMNQLNRYVNECTIKVKEKILEILGE
jgi:hypothetical protein